MEMGEREIELIRIFEDITGVMPLEVFEDDNAIFFELPFKKIRQAIGKEGKNIMRLEKKIGKKIYVFASANNVELFVRNFLNNVRIISLDVEKIIDDLAVYIVVDERDKKKLLGKNKSRLRMLKKLLKEKFNAVCFLKTRVMPV